MNVIIPDDWHWRTTHTNWFWEVTFFNSHRTTTDPGCQSHQDYCIFTRFPPGLGICIYSWYVKATESEVNKAIKHPYLEISNGCFCSDEVVFFPKMVQWFWNLETKPLGGLPRWNVQTNSGWCYQYVWIKKQKCPGRVMNSIEISRRKNTERTLEIHIFERKYPFFSQKSSVVSSKRTSKFPSSSLQKKHQMKHVYSSFSTQVWGVSPISTEFASFW